MRNKGLWVVLGGIGLVSLMLTSVSEGRELSDAQRKLLAKRAATVDAYRNLAETIKGLQITSDTYVRDFVAESDEIRTELDTFIKGIKVTNVRYLPDGTCEVKAQVTIQRLIAELKRIWKKVRTRVGRKRWKEKIFERIVYYTDKKVITATGSGVPPDKETAAAEEVQAPVISRIQGWENVTPRGKLMAQRAALVDAYRNLAETVKGLRITSDTYVRDFVAESDEIRTSLDTFIKGIKPASRYRYLPEGICEVDVQVTIQDVVHHLKTIQRRVRRWRTIYYKTIKLDRIIGYSPKRIIKATGSGVPPAKYMKKGVPAAPAPVVTAPSWAGRTVRATGSGIPPEGKTGTEARLMAERAAKVDAYRNLTELVYGVRIDAATTVEDFVTQRDEIKATVSTFIRGAKVVDTRYLNDGSIEVELELPLSGVWACIKGHM